MTTDHRAEAERWIKKLPQAQHVDFPLRAGDRASTASAHLLAAIHDGQAEQTELLHRIRDLLAVMAEPKGDIEVCGCWQCEPKPHEHFWKRQQNVTSRGYAMDAIEVCECGAARKADPEPGPEPVTVTLPRDVVDLAMDRLDKAASWAGDDGQAAAAREHMEAWRALAYALDAATQEAEQGERVAQGAGGAEGPGDGDGTHPHAWHAGWEAACAALDRHGRLLDREDEVVVNRDDLRHVLAWSGVASAETRRRLSAALDAEVGK